MLFGLGNVNSRLDGGSPQVLDGGEEVAVGGEEAVVRTYREVTVGGTGYPICGPVGDGKTGVCRYVYLEIPYPDLLSFEVSQAHLDVVFYLREGVVGEPELYGALG